MKIGQAVAHPIELPLQSGEPGCQSGQQIGIVLLSQQGFELTELPRTERHRTALDQSPGHPHIMTAPEGEMGNHLAGRLMIVGDRLVHLRKELRRVGDDMGEGM